MGKSHLCNPSYDLTGKCKFCGHKPCFCDEKHPHGRPQVVERIFFNRSSPDAPRLAAAAAVGGVRGAWSPRSDWGRESVLRSLLALALSSEEDPEEVTHAVVRGKQKQ